jgi:hypothetical protein
MSTNQKGAIAEMRIAAEALELGCTVYRPVSEGCRYDLIIDVGGPLLRVQCKWASVKGATVVVYSITSRLTPRGYVRTTYGPTEVDGGCRLMSSPARAWCTFVSDRRATASSQG